MLANCYSHVTVEVYGLDGGLIKSESVLLPKPTVRGDFVMHSLDKSALPWKYTKMHLSGKELPVVTEIVGLKAAMPATAWILTLVGSDGARKENVGMMDIEVNDGDTLSWRYWNVGELAKASRKAATPVPTPAQMSKEEEDDEDDAAVLARERTRELELERSQPKEVEVLEIDGGLDLNAKSPSDNAIENGEDGENDF